MRSTIESALIKKVLELDPQDQGDVLGYVEHVQRVRRINTTTRYHENALREIREALVAGTRF